MSEIAGVKAASLVGCPHNSKKMGRRAEGFHVNLNGHVFDPERLCEVVRTAAFTVK